MGLRGAAGNIPCYITLYVDDIKRKLSFIKNPVHGDLIVIACVSAAYRCCGDGDGSEAQAQAGWRQAKQETTEGVSPSVASSFRVLQHFTWEQPQTCMPGHDVHPDAVK